MSYPNAVFQGCRVLFEAVMTWFAFSNPITFRKWQSQDVSRCMFLVGQNTHKKVWLQPISALCYCLHQAELALFF